MIEHLHRIWCRIWHTDISFAGGRTYRCRTCHREYATPWRST